VLSIFVYIIFLFVAKKRSKQPAISPRNSGRGKFTGEKRTTNLLEKYTLFLEESSTHSHTAGRRKERKKEASRSLSTRNICVGGTTTANPFLHSSYQG
jgi:hypothetical protein